MKMSYAYLLQIIHSLRRLDVQLENVEDCFLEIQHSFREANRSEHFSDNTFIILKLDGYQELSSQGCSKLASWDEILFGPHATELKDFWVFEL